MHGITIENGQTTNATRGRRGPVEGEHVIGYDTDPSRRPGSPMHAAPSPFAGAPVDPPARQAGHERRIHRAALRHPTPVFGTAQPPRGISGIMRGVAYAIPEHHARHWMLLMAADRVDVLEDRLGAIVAEPLETLGATGAARAVRSNPAPYLLGAVAGLLVARTVLD